MEHNETGRARTRTLLRTWAGIAAIFFLTEFFAVVAPLRGQSLSGKDFDPFAGLQQRLEVAADEQLARLPSRPIANVVPRGSEFSLKQEATFVPGRGRSAEQRFQILGIDGGGIFRAEGVPVGLLRIAEVESNWKPFALSSKGALGLWQLMPATARRYGLRVDSMRDDRVDMDKSTRAAARYLRDLHRQFGDWALALAAYNAGERAVQKAMERGGSNDFENLSRRKLLPAETRAYVPAVLGSFDLPRTERESGSETKSNAKFVEPRIMYAGATPGNRIEELHAEERRKEPNFDIWSARPFHEDLF